jgi:hypothetical protein
MIRTLPALLIPLFALFSLAGLAQTKIFIYINSHNEDNIGYLNPIGGYNIYMQNRSALVALANLTQTKGAKQNWGSDHVALRAIARYDTGATLLNTNGKNLVRWMSEDKGVKCDPHSHEATYNYGDVAYFMSQLGVSPSGSISGFLYNQLQNGNNWEDYQDGIQGDSFPAYTWYPDILWGGGTPNHVADLNYYCVYKIKSMAEPQVHEPGNHLTLCGTGCTIKLDDTSTIAYNMSIIHRLVDAVENGTLPANGIYPQEIMFNEGRMRQPYFLPLMTEMMDSVNALVAAGKVEWKTITEIVDYWKSSYDSVPFAVDCDLNTVIGLPTTSITEHEVHITDLQILPNPFNDRLVVELTSLSLNKQPVQIFDCTGREIFEAAVADSYPLIIPTAAWSKGVYFLKAGDQVRKIIRE